MPKKHIWIINDYAGAPKYGMTFRHFYLAKAFQKEGYDTTVISAAYSHFFKKYPGMGSQKIKQENISDVEFVWLKVIRYGKSFSKKRVLKWFLFTLKLFTVDKYIKNTPDFIVCSPSAPFAILPAYFLAKKYRARLIFEVRDIWPLTLVEVGRFSPWNPFILLMKAFERFALHKSDIIVSNLEHYNTYLEEEGLPHRAYWISNGICLDEMMDSLPLDDGLIHRIPKDKFIIGYTGKIGTSNALDTLIEAAKVLRDRKEYFFVIVGEGQEKQRLVNQADDLSNILFVDAIDKVQIPEILAYFDVCYIGLKKEKLFRYGVSPNKLFDYMYAAKPIIFAVDIAASHVRKAQCGIQVEAENISELVGAIEHLSTAGRQELDKMGENAKEYVMKHYTYRALAKRYIEILEQNGEDK